MVGLGLYSSVSHYRSPPGWKRPSGPSGSFLQLRPSQTYCTTLNPLSSTNQGRLGSQCFVALVTEHGEALTALVCCSRNSVIDCQSRPLVSNADSKLSAGVFADAFSITTDMASGSESLGKYEGFGRSLMDHRVRISCSWSQLPPVLKTERR